jgi:hypothetical protein
MFPMLSGDLIGIIAQVCPAGIACAKEFAQLVAREAAAAGQRPAGARRGIFDLEFMITDLDEEGCLRRQAHHKSEILNQKFLGSAPAAR